MGNLQARGAAWLAKQQRRHASSMVTYRRGAASAVMPAVRGKTDAVTADAGGGAIDATIDDWIIVANDLVLGGIKVLPLEGDLIIDANSGAAVIYQVVAVPGGPCFRWSDPQGIRYRVHVERIPPET